MRSYLTTDGLFVRTQAEAGKNWLRVELPDDQAGRIALYNALTGKAEQGDWWWLVEAIRPAIDCPTVQTATAKAMPDLANLPGAKILHTTTPVMHPSLTDVEAFIQSADAYQLRSLFENVVLRGRELIGEARP